MTSGGWWRSWTGTARSGLTWSMPTCSLAPRRPSASLRQLDLARLARCRWRRHDRPDVTVWCLVEVDDHWRVVTWPGALAGMPVNPRRLDPAGHRRARQHQIDPHAEVLVKHAGSVVPVREDALVRPALAHNIVQAHRFEARQCCPFRLGDVRLPDISSGIENVRIGWSDIHVAAHQRGLGTRPDIPLQRGEPLELVLIVLRAGSAPVRDIDSVDADAIAAGRHRARLLVGEAGTAWQPLDHVVEASAGQDRDAVPARLPVHGGLISTGFKLRAEQFGECVVIKLEFLHAHHIGLALIEPRQQSWHALLDGIHVPGCDPHRPYSSPSGGTARRGGAGTLSRRGPSAGRGAMDDQQAPQPG